MSINTPFRQLGEIILFFLIPDPARFSKEIKKNSVIPTADFLLYIAGFYKMHDEPISTGPDNIGKEILIKIKEKI